MKLPKLWTLGTVLALAAVPALAQGFGGRGPGGFGGGGGSLLGLLRMQEVQTEIKLDQTQKELLDQLSAEIRKQSESRFQGFRDLSPEERRQRFQQMQATFEKERVEQDKKVAEILEPKQVARLKQLQVQQGGIRAIERPDVAAQLKLSPDQKTRIKAATDAEDQARRSMFTGFGGGEGQRPSPEQFQEIRTKMETLRTSTDAKLNGILTPAQKTQFEGMKGPAFKFPERRGGPGGRGGQGGQGGRGQRPGNT